MPLLSPDARWRIFIAHTDRTIGTEIADAIDAANTNTSILSTSITNLQNTVGTVSEVMISPARSDSSPGQGPQPVAYGAVLVHEYTPNTDAGYRMYKIPSGFVGNASFHVHWTKTSNVDESGHTVRWRVSYIVANGTSDDINIAPSTILLDDVYDSVDTTNRVLHRTANVPITGLVAGYYLFVKIEALTPPGTPLTTDPALLSLDLRYDTYINK